MLIKVTNMIESAYFLEIYLAIKFVVGGIVNQIAQSVHWNSAKHLAVINYFDGGFGKCSWTVGCNKDNDVIVFKVRLLYLQV